MKLFKRYIVFGFWLLTFCIKAQSNLVPNPSFETYTMCPTSSAQIYNAVPWIGPTGNSTDYYNSCSSNYGISHPGILPRTGNAIGGFGSYNGVGLNGREYLQTPLTNTLVIGKCYYVEFYVILMKYYRYAINNLGVCFSNQLYPTSASVGTVINCTPSILKFGNPIIKDTLNWTKIAGIYTAMGGEGYITIGNFKDDAHTDTLTFNPNNVGSPSATYHFVDDVSVIPTDSISMPPYAGRDTTITLGDSVFIGQQLYGLNCNWYCNNVLINTNISGIWVKPTITTKYVVEQNLCGNTDYDTVTVSISTVGIKKYSFRDNTTIYPNPNAGKELFITPVGLTNGSLQIKLTDLEGRIVYENTCMVTDGLSNLKITDITNGVYFVHITNTTTEEKVIKKLVIQY